MELGCTCGGLAIGLLRRYPELLKAPACIEVVALAEGWTILEADTPILTVALVSGGERLLTISNRAESPWRRYAIAQEVALALRDPRLDYIRVNYGWCYNRCCSELAAGLLIHGDDCVNAEPASVVAARWDVPLEAVYARRLGMLRTGCRVNAA